MKKVQLWSRQCLLFEHNVDLFLLYEEVQAQMLSNKTVTLLVKSLYLGHEVVDSRVHSLFRVDV